MSSFESVTFDRYLDDRKALIETALSDALSSSDANSKAFVDSMRYPLLAGGKRLRPILCLACCEMFGGDVRAALPTAVAIEMIHTMSLIHDDLPAMGNHSTRRGKPTIHTAFGEDIAILSGDALLAKAFEIIVQDSTLIGADKVLQILGRLGAASGAMGLAGNQAKELAAQKLSSSGDVTIESMEVQKTIALIKVSVALGAFVAGATASDIVILEQYAENIGIAFHCKLNVLCVLSLLIVF